MLKRRCNAIAKTSSFWWRRIAVVCGGFLVLSSAGWSATPSGLGDLRSQFAGRIDLGQSRILLRPAMMAEVTTTRSLDVTRFLDAIRTDQDEGPFEFEPSSLPFFVAQSRTQQVHVDLIESSVQVMDLNGYEAPARVALDDEELLSRAKALTVPLGASMEELELNRVTSLAAKVKTHGVPGVVEQRLIARKVFFQRSLGGIRVLGDNVVVSFALDGTFRALTGRWHAVDWSRSKVASSLSIDQFVERAIDAAIANGVDAGSKERIRLGTGYVLRQAGDGWTAELRGLIAVGRPGPTDSTTGQSSAKKGLYDFEI